YLLSSFSCNNSPTTPISTLSLHDALPISQRGHDRRRPIILQSHLTEFVQEGAFMVGGIGVQLRQRYKGGRLLDLDREDDLLCNRSEEHTSELQSPCNLVCRLLLEKKKKIK